MRIEVPGMRRAIMAVGFAIAGTASAWAGAAEPQPVCHHEGKDPYCSHYQATLATLLAEESYRPEEADSETDVIHCFLDVEINPDTEAIAGSNTLTVDSLVANLTTFTIDLQNNMAVDGITIGGAPAAYTRANHEIVITLDRAYNAGERFEVQVAYHGSPENQGLGSFKWSTHNGMKMVSTLSSPWYAHTWWPCKDVLKDKFTLDMWVTVPSWMKVASNGILVGEDVLPDNRTRYRWQTSYQIVTYLVTFAATNYVSWNEYYNHAGGSMPVTFFAYPEKLSAMAEGVGNVVEAITTFSGPDVYGEYPFINEKYGIVQFPFLGGMEHQTMTAQGVFFDYVNVHELAHQWWGDEITCATWHDMWLNEGFATYSEALYFEKRPGGNMNDYHNWMYSRRPYVLSGSVYVYDDSTIASIYNTSNVYYKGSWILHMLRHVVGDETFFNILAEYRATFAGGSATTNDFKLVAESVYGADLSWFFGRWIYGFGVPSYRWGYQEFVDGGERQLRVFVEQTQDYNNFVMPIDIVVNTTVGPTTHVVWSAADRQWYVLPVTEGLVTNATFDPQKWVLTEDRAYGVYHGPLQLVDASPTAGPPEAPAMNVNTVDLWFSDGIEYADGDFEIVGSASGAVPVTVSYDATERRITLTTPTVLPAGETWTVSVRDAVIGYRYDESLDGEISDPIDPASLPSGNGLPGGDAVFSFTVAYTGDFDLDQDVDLEDFGRLQTCLGGPDVSITNPDCESSDFDRDGDVDQDDFLIIQPCIVGHHVAPGPGCG